MGRLEDELRELFEQFHQSHRWYNEGDWKSSVFLLDTVILMSTRLKLFPKLFYYALILRLELAFLMDSSSPSLLHIHLDRLAEFQQWNECIHRTKYKRYSLYDELSSSWPVTTFTSITNINSSFPSSTRTPSPPLSSALDRRQLMIKRNPTEDDPNDEMLISSEHVTSTLTYYRIRLRILIEEKEEEGSRSYDQPFSMIDSWMSSSLDKSPYYSSCRSSLGLLYAYLLWKTHQVNASILHLVNMESESKNQDQFILWNNLACIHLIENRPASARVFLLRCLKHLRQVFEGSSRGHNLNLSSLKLICHNLMITFVRLTEDFDFEAIEQFIENHHLSICI